MFSTLTGSIRLSAADPTARQLQAALHELMHDGATRLGVDVDHDTINLLALCQAEALLSRGGGFELTL